MGLLLINIRIHLDPLLLPVRNNPFPCHSQSSLSHYRPHHQSRRGPAQDSHQRLHSHHGQKRRISLGIRTCELPSHCHRCCLKVRPAELQPIE